MQGFICQYILVSLGKNITLCKPGKTSGLHGLQIPENAEKILTDNF